MPKRNFEAFRDLPRPQKTQLSHSRQNDRINNVLEYSTTAIFRALKLAKGFERQKLGRRQKTAVAEKQLDHIQRLKLEVVELKALDLAKTAQSHLYKTLSKIKSIAASDGLPEYVRESLRRGQKTELAECLNVQARLFNSEVVQKATDTAVEGVRSVLGVAKQDAGGKKRLRSKDHANGKLLMKEEENRIDAEDVRSYTAQKEDDDEWEGFSSATNQSNGSPQPPPDIDEDLSSIDGDDYQSYESRLAASSDTSSSNDDLESLHQDASPPKPHLEPRVSHRVCSLSHSLSPPPRPFLHDSKKPPKAPKPTPATSTTFLPTLLTTGYFSGSDSDAPSLSSGDSDHQSRRPHPPRKNRMGQQARRALWEKKYKDRANHLQNETGRNKQVKAGSSKGDERKAGWDVRRGAVGRDVDGSRGRWGRRGGGRMESRKQTGANMDSVSDKRGRSSNALNHMVNGDSRQKAGGSLHPSWEAARRAKEAKSAAAKPLGKKVIF